MSARACGVCVCVAADVGCGRALTASPRPNAFARTPPRSRTGNYLIVCDEVNDKSEPELRAVKLLADYLADVDNQASVVTKVKVRARAPRAR